MVNSILILAIIVLPGWISISAAQLHHPRIADRTTAMVWGMLFYHAAVVHIVGLGVVSAITLAWQGYFLDTIGLDRILIDGPSDFAKKAPGTAFVVFGAYFLWMVAGSAISGVVDLPAKLTTWIGLIAWKAGLASKPVGDEPVWYRALELDRREEESNVQVFVRMKNGDSYIGDLQSYPILPDSVESKDIQLGGNSALYLDRGDSSPVEIDFRDHGGGGVLLNTTNISSIHYRFHKDYDRGNSPT